MKDMTSKQIRDRLAEIAKQQAAHDARDFDGELKVVMLAGGDVDALEERQLQDERTARRLRVERTAMEGALPDAQQREALAELATIKNAMADQPERIKALSEKIAPLAAELAPLLTELTDVFNQRTLAYAEAAKFARTNKLPADALAGTGQIICQQATEATQQLSNALGYTGVDIGNPLELMRYSTGPEYVANAIEID